MKTIEFKNALLLHQQGDFDKATLLYQQILEGDPTQADCWYMLGIISAQKNHIEKACSLFSKAIALREDKPEYFNNAGNAYMRLGELTQAEHYYRKATQLKQNYAEAHNNLGVLYYHQRQFEKAEKEYERAIEIEPNYLEAHYNLGELLLARARYASAIQHFERVKVTYPDSLKVDYQLANAYLLQGQLEKAKQLYLLILERHGTVISVLINLGAIAIQQDQPQMAIDYFTNVLMIDEANSDAHHNLASLFMEHDRFENAISHYEEILGQNPDDPEVNYNLATAYMALGKMQEAILYFEHVLKHQAKPFDVHVNLAILYRAQHKPELAKQHFEKARQLRPEDPSIQFMCQAFIENNSVTVMPQEYVTQVFENYAWRYDKHLIERLHYELPLLMKKMLEHAFPEKKEWVCLDLGCGTGLVGEQLHTLVHTITGIDLSKRMIHYAKQKKCYHTLEVMDIHDYLKTTERTYDLIVAADVLGYIGDLKDLLAGAKKALKKDGVLIFSIEPTQHYPYHLQKYARFAHHPAYIQTLIESLNFKILTTQSVVAREQNDKPVEMLIYLLH